MKPAAMWRPGLNANTCAITWAKSFRARSQRSPALGCSSRWRRCTSKAWCTSVSWVGTITALMRCAKSCAVSVPACAMPLAPACKCRSAGWTWMPGALIFAWCRKRTKRGKRAKTLPLHRRRNVARAAAGRRGARRPCYSSKSRKRWWGHSSPMHALMRPQPSEKWARLSSASPLARKPRPRTRPAALKR